MRRLIPYLLMVALVLPGVGCKTIEAFGDLDGVGAVDVAIDAALLATDEAIEQRELILADIEAGKGDIPDLGRRFERIGTAVRSVHAAVGAAEIARRAGDMNTDELAGAIMVEVGELYTFIRSEVK